MKRQIQPARTIGGVLCVPGDKSIAHRAAILSLLAREQKLLVLATKGGFEMTSRNESITKKAVVWLTLISFTLSCSGCTIVSRRDHPSGVAHAGQTQSTSVEMHVDGELCMTFLVLAVMILAAATGNMHGSYHGHGSYHY